MENRQNGQIESPDPEFDGNDPVSVVMVNINGYGMHYLKTLLEAFPDGCIDLRAAIDPDSEGSPLYPELQKRNIPVLDSLDRFYADGGRSDLVIVSSPIHWHASQSCTALKHGSHVLCEKPVAATVQEVDTLIAEQHAASRTVHIGYQWSYSSAIQALKSDILAGLLGKPRRLKMLYLWPRNHAYYRRNDYAGRLQSEDGRWVLDSIAHGAMAHDIHNMFYILGNSTGSSAVPKSLTAEIYRAYPIENFDTAACRALMQDGTELLFCISHAVQEKHGPFFSFEFEEAVISYGEQDEIVARDRHGNEKRYGSPFATDQFRKLFYAVEHIQKDISSPPDSSEIPVPLCGPEASRAQVVCVNGMQESMPEIIEFPRARVREETQRGGLWVEDLSRTWVACYENNHLPHEMNIPWSRQGEEVDLSDYRWYPGGRPPEKP